MPEAGEENSKDEEGDPPCTPPSRATRQESSREAAMRKSLHDDSAVWTRGCCMRADVADTYGGVVEETFLCEKRGQLTVSVKRAQNGEDIDKICCRQSSVCKF